MKNIIKFLLAILVVVCVGVVVVQNIAVEVPDGEEPTKVQAVLLWIQEQCSLIASMTGVGASTLCIAVLTGVRNSANGTNVSVEQTTKEVTSLAGTVSVLLEELKTIKSELKDTSTSEAKLSKALEYIFSNSNAPASIRSQVSAILGEEQAPVAEVEEPQVEQVEDVKEEEASATEAVAELVSRY